MRLNTVPRFAVILLLSVPSLAQEPRSPIVTALERAREVITYEMAVASQDLTKATLANPKKLADIEKNLKETVEARARLESKKDAQTILNTLLMNELARGSALNYPPEKQQSQKVPVSADQAVEFYSKSADDAQARGSIPDYYAFKEKARIWALVKDPASAPIVPASLKSELQQQLQGIRDAITNEQAQASKGVSIAVVTLLKDRKPSDAEAEVEARATFEAKLKTNKYVDSLLVNLLARKSAWGFGQGEERQDLNLVTLQKDLLIDQKRTFAEQAALIKKQLDDVLSSQRSAALREMRAYEPIWDKAKQEPDEKVKKQVDGRMQWLANEYYKKDLAFKRGAEEARLYEELSGFDPSGRRLSGSKLAKAETTAEKSQ